MKQATNIDEQILLLKSRGLNISDEQKAKEVLMDIGYYRIGFYLYSFEKSYPKLTNRTHIYKAGIEFSDAVALYYYDFDMRNILLRYINRIEVAFRTYIIYELSNKYKNEPTWFISPSIVSQNFIQNFDKEIYNENFKNNPIIHRHHKKYINDKYAPAWKTIEFMTLGNVLKLYKSLKHLDDKRAISMHFGIKQTTIMENYMETVRVTRNKCAHGSTLFDISLSQSIKNGPAGRFQIGESNNLAAVIDVILYLLGIISKNRRNDMVVEISDISSKSIAKSHAIKEIIENNKIFLKNLLQ